MPEVTVPPADGVDALGDALRALRVRGRLLLGETYRAPFTVEVPPAARLAELLGSARDDRVIAFHLAQAGCFELRRDGAPSILVEPGEVVLCIDGEAHRLAQGDPDSARSFEEILSEPGMRIWGAVRREDPSDARILCGALALSDTRLNPLFAALPPVLHLRGDVAGGERLRATTSLLSSEIERGDAGAGYVVERLLEVLCAEGVRAHARVGAEATGWFAGLADPPVGRALAAVHGAPGAAWSVELLARRANLSPSRFAARFRDTVGVSAMVYVTRWRMNVAMRALTSGDVSIAQLAHRLGYESLPAFSRAFKKHVGVPPASWRSSHL